MNKQQTLAETLFFWLSITIISLAAGFIGGGIRADRVPVQEIVQPQKTIVLEDRTRGEEKQQSQLSTILSAHAQSMIAIYRWQRPQKIVGSNDLPRASQFVGYGLVVTSDGWLVSSATLDERAGTYSAFIAQDEEPKAIEKVVRDKIAGYTFIKIKGNNLRPIEYVAFTDPLIAENAYLIRDQFTIEPIPVTIPRPSSPQAPEDWLMRTSLLTKVLNPSSSYDQQCMPVVLDDKRVLGCTTARGIRTFRYLQRSLSDLLKRGVIERPAIDIPYINLATVPTFVHPTARRGALIVLGIKEAVVLTGADGTTVRLKNGDVIISVNGETVDQNRDLGELLGQYARKETITVRVLSGGAEKEQRIILN